MDALSYNRMFTLHGIVMIFLFLIPAIPSAFGNFVLPLMLGARDVAFPRINLFSFYLYVIGAAIALWGMIHGGADTGWTFYTPYSSTTPTQVAPILLGAFILGFSSILTGLNFIVTVQYAARPRPGLDEDAALRLVRLRDQRHPDPRHPCPRHHALDRDGGAGSAALASSIRRWAATRSCSSTCSGSTRTPRSTS